jgi:hypothetical protein
MTRVYNNNSNNNVFNFYFNFSAGTDAACALGAITQSPYFQSLQDTLARGQGTWSNGIPQCACIPAPDMRLSAAPAGRGLADASGQCGWPANTTATAGGYHIVANGGTRVTIYAPGQGPDAATPYASWDGDPHFHGAGGKSIDFAGGTGIDGQKGQDMVLSDGTRMFAQLSDDHGHPVTTGLVIQNGVQRRTFDNMQETPSGGAFTNDGYEWRAQHVAAGAAGNVPTWYLRGDTNNIDVIQGSHGRIDGLVTGSHEENGTYVSNVDQNIKYAGLGPGMRQPPFSRAWGNDLRDEILDADANALGRRYGSLGVAAATQDAFRIHAGHIEGQFRSDLRSMYGGWPTYWNNDSAPWRALSDFRDLLLADNEWQRMMRNQQYQLA